MQKDKSGVYYVYFDDIHLYTEHRLLLYWWGIVHNSYGLVYIYFVYDRSVKTQI